MMRKNNHSPYPQMGLRFAIQIWVAITAAALLFAVVVTLCVANGLDEDKSIVASLISVGLLTLGGFYLYRNKFSSESFITQADKLDRVVKISSQHVGHRLYQIFAGASPFDLAVDLMRLAGVLGLGIIVFIQHGSRLFTFDRGLLFSLIFFTSLSFIVFHEFIYPFLRRESIWEQEYKYRKLLMTTAINDVVTASVEGTDADSLRDIEGTTLRAIKSFLEFAALEKSKDNFNVNLLVEHPTDGSKLICVQRTNPKKKVPTFYNKADMPTAVRVMQECTPIYIGQFIPTIKTDKEYRMVWQIPVLLPLNGTEKPLGIIAIDSKMPDHLSLVDSRAALLFNLMPYIALIRFSLTQRYTYDIWEDVLNVEPIIGKPHITSLNPEERRKYLDYLEAAFDFDRNNLDKTSLEIATENEGNVLAKVECLKVIATKMPTATSKRRAFSALFPYVETNNRKIHS